MLIYNILQDLRYDLRYILFLAITFFIKLLQGDLVCSLRCHAFMR